MSLTSFVNMPDVRAKVKTLRPIFPRKLSLPLKAEPRSRHYALVGTAFDYLLRFELQRRAPHAISDRWVAETAPKMMWKTFDTGSALIAGGMDLLANAPPDQYIHPQLLAERARIVLDNAKAALKVYLKKTSPTSANTAAMARHAIRLAKLDSVYRAWKLEPTFEDVSPEDVEDLVELLTVVPFDELVHHTVMLLNPTFGEASRLVGGADADLIAGDLLLDMKTTKEGKIKVSQLDQILGYLLLARRQHYDDPDFPIINRLGLYYARHGYLWSLDASVWTSHPCFREIEPWFFQRAKELLAARKRAHQ